MSQGDHAADDGSFARSAGVHAGRAAILIAAALAIGFLVLDDSGGTGPDPSRDLRSVDLPESTTTTQLSTTTTVAVRPAEQVRVISLNATSTAGVAARVADRLRVAKYNVLPSGNATATARAAETASVVYYTPGYDREALLIASVVNIPPARVKPLGTPPATDLRGANVVVLVKEDLASGSTTTAPTTTTRKP